MAQRGGGTHILLKVYAGTIRIDSGSNQHGEDVSAVMSELIGFAVDRNSVQASDAEVDWRRRTGRALKLYERPDEAQVVAQL